MKVKAIVLTESAANETVNEVKFAANESCSTLELIIYFSVRATEDYKGNGGELNIKKGNIIQYTTRVNEHFSFGCLNDKWGNFPSQIAQVSVTEKDEIKMELRLGESQ